VVAGHSGIGKSMLVRELYRPVTERRGYFTSGKFDQFQRSTPYSAVVSAFKTSGQRCVSASRILVHDKLVKPFIDRFVATAKRIRIGDPLDSGNFTGHGQRL